MRRTSRLRSRRCSPWACSAPSSSSTTGRRRRASSVSSRASTSGSCAAAGGGGAADGRPRVPAPRHPPTPLLIGTARGAAAADALCDLLDWLTAAAYAPLSPSKLVGAAPAAAPAAAGPPPRRSRTAAPPRPRAPCLGVDAGGGGARDAPVLQRLGVGLHRRPVLFARACRLGVAALGSAAPAAARDGDGRAGDAATTQRVVEACNPGTGAAVARSTVSATRYPGLVHELMEGVARAAAVHGAHRRTACSTRRWTRARCPSSRWPRRSRPTRPSG